MLTTTLDKALTGAAPNSIFPATFGLACCAIEMMSIVSPRYDIARFGAEDVRASPRQADMLILSGRVSIKMAPVVRRIYDQMLEPKWVISMGACSSSGGMFANYAVVQGADKFMPVDIHVPGCPPRPEALIYGFNKLQRMILGHPDPGWRRRYNAIGTEEWARDDAMPASRRRRRPRRYAGRARARSPWPTSAGRGRRPRAGGAADARRPRPRADRPGARTTPHEGSVLGTYHEHGQACLIVDPEQILDVLGWLRDTPGQEYRFLASLHGVDYLPAEPRFGVHYELLNMRAGRAPAGPRRARRPRRRRAARSSTRCVELFPTAEFQEREVYDFFGIVFRGHPDLRRILMPEDYVGWPQRRDFPIGGEPVIFTHNEREVPGWYE